MRLNFTNVRKCIVGEHFGSTCLACRIVASKCKPESRDPRRHKFNLQKWWCIYRWRWRWWSELCRLNYLVLQRSIASLSIDNFSYSASVRCLYVYVLFQKRLKGFRYDFTTQFEGKYLTISSSIRLWSFAKLSKNRICRYFKISKIVSVAQNSNTLLPLLSSSTAFAILSIILFCREVRIVFKSTCFFCVADIFCATLEKS